MGSQDNSTLLCLSTGVSDPSYEQSPDHPSDTLACISVPLTSDCYGPGLPGGWEGWTFYLVSSGKSLKDGRISCGNPVLPNGTKD